jgi:hypothetical protein
MIEPPEGGFRRRTYTYKLAPPLIVLLFDSVLKTDENESSLT